MKLYLFEIVTILNGVRSVTFTVAPSSIIALDFLGVQIEAVSLHRIGPVDIRTPIKWHGRV